jgi:hypothetical protein
MSNPWQIDLEPTHQRRTFNRELDLESGQWEEAIRREERRDHLDSLEIMQKYYEALTDEDWQALSGKYHKLNQLKGSNE